ncbi:MAG: methylated-DNA--[protein]-cysteine S-methyltransferase [Anaerolineae bacterium]|nr:methylated-DNA--[protein]-cysteine S-methyltransferase [Anaerolineae bacterium]
MNDEKRIEGMLNDTLPGPTPEVVVRSHRAVKEWFAREAPTVYWDTIDTPVGRLYMAAGEAGLSHISFGIEETRFMATLDPLAHAVRSPERLLDAARQIEAYFRGEFHFDLPVDLDMLTPFQREVLRVVASIPAGAVMTYREVAAAVGRPRASRAVGNAVARNPVPIVIPCHRVVASNGLLGGYSGGGGIRDKISLLRLEGAPVQHLRARA